MTYYMAGEGRRLFGQTTPSELPNKFAMSVRQSVGVCGMITPWNFPMAIPSWKMMPALVSGNTVVLKPAEDTPLSSYHLVQTLVEAGLPAGVVNLVSGDGPNAGAPLSQHKGVPVMSFTGSSAVGRIIAQACAPDFKHVSLEMGGKNIIIVMDDANLDLAVDGAVWGGFGTTGQRCTAASRVAVHKSVYGKFVERLVERVKKLKLGDGLDPTVEMGPCINEQQLNGPVVSLIPVHDFAEAIEVANGVQYGLSASIYTKNVNQAFEAMRDIYTGIVYVNAPTIGAETHLPFGGTKQTGNGHREAAISAIDFFTEWKTLYIDYSDRLQRAQIDNN
jgi:aldehyde dehydrogenase (NAD+)